MNEAPRRRGRPRKNPIPCDNRKGSYYDIYKAPSFMSQTWTKEEDREILQYAEKSNKNWFSAPSYFHTVGKRTPFDYSRRYNYLTQIKNQWTPLEDDKLVQLVSQFGDHNWQAVSKSLPGHTAKQCCIRYSGLLASQATEPWTEEEDQIIYNLYSNYGTQYAKYISELPGRTLDEIKVHTMNLIQQSPRDTVGISSSGNSGINDDEEEILDVLSETKSLPQISSNSPHKTFLRLDEKPEVYQRAVKAVSYYNSKYLEDERKRNEKLINFELNNYHLKKIEKLLQDRNGSSNNNRSHHNYHNNNNNNNQQQLNKQQQFSNNSNNNNNYNNPNEISPRYYYSNSSTNNNDYFDGMNNGLIDEFQQNLYGNNTTITTPSSLSCSPRLPFTQPNSLYISNNQRNNNNNNLLNPTSSLTSTTSPSSSYYSNNNNNNNNNDMMNMINMMGIMNDDNMIISPRLSPKTSPRLLLRSRTPSPRPVDRYLVDDNSNYTYSNSNNNINNNNSGYYYYNGVLYNDISPRYSPRVISPRLLSGTNIENGDISPSLKDLFNSNSNNNGNSVIDSAFGLTDLNTTTTNNNSNISPKYGGSSNYEYLPSPNISPRSINNNNNNISETPMSTLSEGSLKNFWQEMDDNDYKQQQQQQQQQSKQNHHQQQQQQQQQQLPPPTLSAPSIPIPMPTHSQRNPSSSTPTSYPSLTPTAYQLRNLQSQNISEKERTDIKKQIFSSPTNGKTEELRNICALERSGVISHEEAENRKKSLYSRQ